jgi:hypothetical protein
MAVLASQSVYLTACPAELSAMWSVEELRLAVQLSVATTEIEPACQLQRTSSPLRSPDLVSRSRIGERTQNLFLLFAVRCASLERRLSLAGLSACRSLLDLHPGTRSTSSTTLPRPLRRLERSIFRRLVKRAPILRRSVALHSTTVVAAAAAITACLLNPLHRRAYIVPELPRLTRPSASRVALSIIHYPLPHSQTTTRHPSCTRSHLDHHIATFCRALPIHSRSLRPLAAAMEEKYALAHSA